MSHSPETSSINPATKAAYWRVVKDCLVEFHGLRANGASIKIRDLRRRLESTGNRLDAEIIYHDEPFYVACDLTGIHENAEQDAILTKHRIAYESLLSVHQW